VIYVVTGDNTSVKFDWGLILDQSLIGVGEMYLEFKCEENRRSEFTCIGEIGPKRTCGFHGLLLRGPH